MGWRSLTFWLFPLFLLACRGPKGEGSPVKPEEDEGPQPMKQQTEEAVSKNIMLKPPRLRGTMSLEEALLKRRSVRTYQDSPLTIDEVSQLLWAAQGITSEDGFRTAPSAGALYPLEIYLVSEHVQGLEKGVYRYNPRLHSLEQISSGSHAEALYRHALYQDPVLLAPLTVVFAAEYARTEVKYGLRAHRYVHLEVGHAVENLLLQAVALGLGAVVIGAYDDVAVRQALRLPPHHAPLALVPVGRPK